MIRVAAIGECMLELTHRDERALALGFGGDTLNTALYLARTAAKPEFAVDYVTALGDDPMSESMIAAWRAEGIGTDRVARIARRLPGLYWIRTGEGGERRFFYWRSEAAVRSLFQTPETEPLLAALPEYDALYFSGATLDVLAPEARRRLRAALEGVRARGRLVAFDTNYRPALWPDPSAARAVFADFLPVISLALPTFEDEQAVCGDGDPQITARRYAAAGVAEIAVKRGASGCVILAGGQLLDVPVPKPVKAVDTTAAGDGFNAGYLAARLTGASPEQAARAGHGLAGAVVQYPGAIIPRAATPSLEQLI
jgi:2-dehydro-3-deoxygluconokinase